MLAVQLGIIERWADVVVASTTRAQGPALARLAAVLRSFREQSEAASEEIRFTRLFEGTTFGTHPPVTDSSPRESGSQNTSRVLAGYLAGARPTAEAPAV